jgi:hypothetical protein
VKVKGKWLVVEHDEFLSNLWQYHGYNLGWMADYVSERRVGELAGILPLIRSSLSTTTSGHSDAPLGACQHRTQACCGV